jgi:hypothetical protein
MNAFAQRARNSSEHWSLCDCVSKMAHGAGTQCAKRIGRLSDEDRVELNSDLLWRMARDYSPLGPSKGL